METIIILKCLLVAVSSVVFLFLAKKIFIVITAAYVLLRDLFLLWNIAFGAHPTRRNMSHPLRLHTYVCNPSLLDHRSITEILTFTKSMVESDHDVSYETFHKIINSYQIVATFRERLDGSLRGIHLLGRNEVERNGKKITIIKLGLAFFEKQYQGGPYFYLVLIYHWLKELILHPRTPIYVIGKTYSYKSYLACLNYCNEAYPVYNKVTPELEKSLLNDFADSIRFPGEKYNPETFILERELTHLKSHVAGITPEDMENPHVNFFAEQNPGWSKGHCMICIAIMDWNATFKAIRKTIARLIRGKKGNIGDKLANKKNSKKFRRQFDRHFSFYSPEAKAKVLDNYKIDHGRAVIKNETSADIYVD